jgi:vitamin B12 transporter
MQKILLRSLLLSSFTPLLFAEDSVELNDILVTASRSNIQQNQLATASTVYTRNDIERLQVKTLPELLSSAAGVDIAQSGGYGQPSSVFMRGTNSSHVLVLIDGIKAGSVSAGITAFQLIPIDQIERVEIVRGPQSSLYGSEAIGGVIQIFTRTGKNASTPKLTLEAGGGSYDTYRSSGTISGKWQKTWYSLGASSMGSEGFSAQTSPADPDRDGYQNTAVNARLGHRFDNGAELEAFFMRAQGETEFDGFSLTSENKTQFVQQVVGGSASINLLDNWRSTLVFGQSSDQGKNFTPDNNFSSRFDSTRWNASWLNQFKLSDTQELTVGSDGRVDEVSGTTAFIRKSRYDVGVFAQLHSRWFDHHFTNASVRWDTNQAFGDYVTGSVGWRYQWKHGISILANFGNAFKAPTFNDLYYPFGSGNPNLKPEQSTSFEVGLSGNHDWAQWELRAYHTDIDNLIVWNPTSFTVENINKSQIDGLEANISGNVLGWHSKLSMNLLSPKDRTTHSRLLRRANKTLSFDISRNFDALDIGATVLAQGNRPDLDSSSWPTVTKSLSGYVTVDLRSQYHFNSQWSISAKLNNLLDQNYQTVNNYTMAKRNFFFSLHYTP